MSIQEANAAIQRWQSYQNPIPQAWFPKLTNSEPALQPYQLSEDGLTYLKSTTSDITDAFMLSLGLNIDCTALQPVLSWGTLQSNQTGQHMAILDRVENTDFPPNIALRPEPDPGTPCVDVKSLEVVHIQTERLFNNVSDIDNVLRTTNSEKLNWMNFPNTKKGRYGRISMKTFRELLARASNIQIWFGEVPDVNSTDSERGKVIYRNGLAFNAFLQVSHTSQGASGRQHTGASYLNILHLCPPNC